MDSKTDKFNQQLLLEGNGGWDKVKALLARKREKESIEIVL